MESVEKLDLSALGEQVAAVLKKPIFMIGGEHPIHVDLGLFNICN